MNNKKIISLLILGLFLLTLTAVTPALTETLQGDEWKKGKVTRVMKYYIEVDGWSHRVSDSVIIKDVSNEVLLTDLKILKGVDEILFRMEDKEIIEIRIFKRRH